MAASQKLKAYLAACTLLAACGNPEATYQYVLTQLGGQTTTKDPLPVAQTYRDAHQSAPTIIDLHADTLLLPDEDGSGKFERLLSNPDRDGHVDVPRLIQGNVALQVFSAPTKGSLDTLGNFAPSVTGKYVDPSGNEYSRYGFERDPNVSAYDDPRDTYQGDYAGSPWFMPRDLATYLFRMSGRDCITWYEDGNWDPSVWNETKPCPAYKAERMYIERLLLLAKRLRDADTEDSRLTVVRTRSELDNFLRARAQRRAQVAALLSTEGLYFRSDVSTAAGQKQLQATFDELYGAGFRMFSLTHFIDNDYGGSSTGMGNASSSSGRQLASAGRLFAERVLSRGAVLDVAHASRSTLASLTELARNARKPLVFSHGGLSDIPGTDGKECDTDRNIETAQIRDIASTGGVVGIGFASEFVCDTAPSAWARAVRHAVDVIDAKPLWLYNQAEGQRLSGVDHVGLGSDYDGGIKAYTDIAHLDQYTRALMCKRTVTTPNCLENPFSAADVHKILGGNALRVLRTNLP
jgi:microsomal dipeptidase-like Zn-dependent dipeptidase